MEICEKGLPQLIVGLDSLSDDANYIHITHTKEENSYYCPCCHGTIKPRACNPDKKYLVQPHFYHVSGGCSEESYVHYICKNWLFEKGSEFVVSGESYHVESVEIEQTLHTSFGDYRPDIIVHTDCGKTFYFEIKVTNKKTDLLIPKWDELGNDVVEVDTRYFVNQKCDNKIPQFDLIYAGGKCFIKKYTHKDYDSTIAKRKLDVKRQDILNYKVKWERLDWFWNSLADYSSNAITEDEVLEFFDQLDYEDKVWCYKNLKTKSCVQFKGEFREHLNNCFVDMLKELEIEHDISITLEHQSIMIYVVTFRKEYEYMGYKMHEDKQLKLKVSKNSYLSLDSKPLLVDTICSLELEIAQNDEIMKKISDVASLPFVSEIHPLSHYASEYSVLRYIDFKYTFKDNIHSQYITEKICEDYLPSTSISVRRITREYLEQKNKRIAELENEFLAEMLKNDSLLQQTIEIIRSKCLKMGFPFLRLFVSDNYKKIILIDGTDEVCEYSATGNEVIGVFENEILNMFISCICRIAEDRKIINDYISRINNCGNRMWKINYHKDGSTWLNLIDLSVGKLLDSTHLHLYPGDDIEGIILSEMKGLLEYAEQHHGIRFMEA